jgi:hypothetical protein
VSDEAASYIGQLSADRLWRWDGTAWRPVMLERSTPLPAWARTAVRSPATWWVVASAILVGLFLNQALRVGAFGAAASITLAGAAVALVFAGRLQRLESRLLAAAAVAFAAWLSLRASPWLVWPDLAASVLLLWTAASFSRTGSLFDLGVAEGLARSVHAALHAAVGTVWAARPLAAVRTQLSAIAPVARGLLIAAPVAVVLGALLASADPVFASFLKLNFDLGQLAADVFLVAVGAAAAAGLLRLASAEPLDKVDGPSWRLGAIEALVVLAVLDAIFAAFAVAQAIAAAGAAGDTLRNAGITYADYARNGFFQLLWVAGITLAVLVVFSRVTSLRERRTRIAFTALAELAIVLTLLIVAVASTRLSLYEDAYGFTMLRLYSHLFAIWVAVVFLLLAADLAGVWSRRRWFAGSSAITALALLMALNFAGPESVVAQYNIDRAVNAQKLDSQYLGELSSDAIPTLLAAHSRLTPELSVQVRAAACAGPRGYSPPLAAYNWAEAAAAGARRAGC